MAAARPATCSEIVGIQETTSPQTCRMSVVIPVYNHPHNLEQCLVAVKAAHLAVEVIVVDDGSTEDVCSVALKHGARYIRIPQRSGPPSARNRGWRAARGELIAFVDSDVVVPSEVLARMQKLVAENPLLAGVFGSYDDEPAAGSFYSQFRNLLHHYIHQVSKEQAQTFWTGCGALRKSVLEESGGFDEALFAMDDVELGMRLARTGALIYLDKSLQVKHLKEWTLASTLHTDIFLRAVPWTRLLAKRNAVPRDLNLGYRARYSAVLVMLLFLTALLLPAYSARHGWESSAPLLALAALSVAGLFFINHDFYAFLARKRGLWFACAGVIAHWFYFFYSGATFLVVWLVTRGSHFRREDKSVALQG